MSAADWTAWASLAGSAVGVMTGITALIISGLNYRRVSILKRLDLRMEARKLNGQLHAEFDTLPKRHDAARKSGERIAAARGRFKSGALGIWQAECEADAAAIRDFGASLPAADAAFSNLDADGLEALVVLLYELHLRGSALAAKIAASLAEDERQRIALRVAN